MKLIKIDSAMNYETISDKKYVYNPSDRILMIPYMTNIADLYIPIVASPLLEFDKAEVDYRLISQEIDYDEILTDSVIKTLNDSPTNSVVFTSFVDLIQFLQSINNINYYNSTMESSNIAGGCTVISVVRFGYIKIKLSRNNKVIFNDSFNCDRYGDMEAIQREDIVIRKFLSPIFKYPKKLFDGYNFVRFKDKYFCPKHRFSSEDVNGLILCNLHLILIIDYEIYRTLDDLSFMVIVYTIDKNELNATVKKNLNRIIPNVDKLEVYNDISYTSYDIIFSAEMLCILPIIFQYEKFNLTYFIHGVYDINHTSSWNPEFVSIINISYSTDMDVSSVSKWFTSEMPGYSLYNILEYMKRGK